MADPFARFQSTHSQRVRRPWTHSIFHILFDFNPRTREGCDKWRVAQLLTVDISIHAPVKGATHGRQCWCHRRLDFNPRTREGCDESYFFRLGVVDSISIHAPVKGATLSREQFVLSPSRFQSTHP